MVAPRALSNGADATSVISVGQAILRAHSLWRRVQQIHFPLSIGDGTRPRNSVSRWKGRVNSPVPVAENKPRKQRDCAASCCSPTQIAFCEQTSFRSLSCGAIASYRALAHAGWWLHYRIEHHPAGIAEFGVLPSETNRYLICIGDELTAEPEHVGCARPALCQFFLREGRGGRDRRA